MQRMRVIGWGLIVTACVAMSSGCSFVGYRFGEVVDGHKPDMKYVDVNHLDRYDRGTIIDVYTRSGEVFTGEFRLLDRDPDNGDVEGVEFYRTFPDPTGMARVSIGKLDHVEVKAPKNARRNLLTVGALIDFALIGTAVYALTVQD